jgi:hypothetical protein
VEISKAIVAVMKAVTGVDKTGKNQHQKYDYSSIEDVLKAVQPIMAEHGLAMVMSTDEYEGDGSGNFVVRYSVSLLHESGKVWLNCAQWISAAKAMDDKWPNKGATAAEKYFLLKLFHIPSGKQDDADADDGSAKVKSPPPRRAPKSDAPQAAQKFIDGVVKECTEAITREQITGILQRHSKGVERIETAYPDIYEKFDGEISSLNERLVE